MDPSKCNVEKNSVVRYQLMKAIPWIFSVLLVFIMLVLMVFFQKNDYQEEETVTVRQVDIALPLPPPPPPIEIEQVESKSNSLSIDLLGMGTGPTIDYAQKPKLAKLKLTEVKLPKFDINSIDLSKTIAVDFTLIEVKRLDQVPKIISSRFVQPPWSIMKKGIKRIPTTVELIIDEKGRAHIKKIIDPVYPEMVETIRIWVKNVRFSIPKKNGQPVRALYLYGLNFNF
jgi:periplasmic protein TonB